MREFKLLFDEVKHHVENIDTLTKPTLKKALKCLLDSDTRFMSFKETYQLGFNPVRLRRSGDILLGFRLLGDSPETITVMIGGTDYDLDLQPNKFEYALLTDVIPIVALTWQDVHLQLKERRKTVYIECISGLVDVGYRSAIAKTDWRLETNVEKDRDFAVCYCGMFGIVVQDLELDHYKQCKNFKIFKQVNWDDLYQKKPRVKAVSPAYPTAGP